MQQVFEKRLQSGGGACASPIGRFDGPPHGGPMLLRRPAAALASPESAMDVDAVAGAVHPAIDVEVRNAAMVLLSALDEDEQRMAAMLFVDGMPQGETAAGLGVSRVTVNNRLQALRARVHGHVEGA